MGSNRRLLRAKRKKALKDYKKNRDVGTCFHNGCPLNGDETFHCSTCEELEKKKPYRIQTCSLHRADAVAKIKRHVLVKHPSNLLKATGAVLAGREMGDV
jgi:hypothetical protein